MSPVIFIFLSFLLLALSLGVVIYSHRSSRIRVRKIVSEDFNGKKLFVLRLNSHDFLFEEKAGKISFLSNIQSSDTSANLELMHDKIEEKALKLLELENAGHS